MKQLSFETRGEISVDDLLEFIQRHYTDNFKDKESNYKITITLIKNKKPKTVKNKKENNK